MPLGQCPYGVAVSRIKQRIPMAETHLQKVRMLFDLYDSDADNSLSLNELCKLLEEIGNKITALPAVSRRGSPIPSSWLIPLSIDGAGRFSAR